MRLKQVRKLLRTRYNCKWCANAITEEQFYEYSGHCCKVHYISNKGGV